MSTEEAGVVYAYLLSGEHLACAPGPGTHPLYLYNEASNSVIVGSFVSPPPKIPVTFLTALQPHLEVWQREPWKS